MKWQVKWWCVKLVSESDEDDRLLEQLRAALSVKAFESEGGTKDFGLESYTVEKRLVLRFYTTDRFK